MQELLELAKEYGRISSVGQIRALTLLIEMSSLPVKEVKRVFQELIQNTHTVWTLKEGDECYIIKETGDIIKVGYLDNDYFHKVRNMGNLTLTRKEAIERVMNWRSIYGKK